MNGLVHRSHCVSRSRLSAVHHLISRYHIPFSGGCGRKMHALQFLPEGTYILMEETPAHNFDKWKINSVKSIHKPKENLARGPGKAPLRGPFLKWVIKDDKELYFAEKERQEWSAASAKGHVSFRVVSRFKAFLSVWRRVRAETQCPLKTQVWDECEKPL